MDRNRPPFIFARLPPDHVPAMPLRPIRISLALVATLAAAGCGELGSGPSPDRPGSLFFLYSGDRSGQYEARGPVPETVSGSYAAAYQAFDELTVFAFDTAGAPRGDRVLIKATPIEPGQSVSGCLGGISLTPGCFVGTVTFGVDPTDFDRPGGVTYVITSGTFRVNAKDSRHISGTFSGIAERSPGGPRIVISAGFFDAPRRPDAPVASRLP